MFEFQNFEIPKGLKRDLGTVIREVFNYFRENLFQELCYLFWELFHLYFNNYTSFEALHRDFVTN